MVARKLLFQHLLFLDFVAKLNKVTLLFWGLFLVGFNGYTLFNRLAFYVVEVDDDLATLIVADYVTVPLKSTHWRGWHYLMHREL